MLLPNLNTSPYNQVFFSINSILFDTCHWIERQCVQEQSNDFRNFNPRSREGSDFHLHLNRLHHRDFNPRSREGSDLYRITFLHSNHISIHAPAKGATRDFLFCYDSNFSFQSTLPRRERLNLESFVNPGITISIHAPAKGATTGF